jgi:hypothetical protein
MTPAGSRILSAAWGSRKGYVFLPYKDTDRNWHEPAAIYYSGDVPSLSNSPAADLYFCPLLFSDPRRKKEYALPTNLLWADLDPVHPNSCRLKPSIAWESSPGRYQALWFLSTELPAEQAAELSKRIAYSDGADKGGWDVTQVLRIPGTKNYKYPSAPEVKLLWARRSAYSVSEIKAAYPPVNGAAATEDIAGKEWPEVHESTIQTALLSLPIGFKKRLMADTTGADRSKELQMLARDLIRFGVDRDVVLYLIQRSTWNKFSGRNDEREQLLKQVSSAVVAVAERKQKAPTVPTVLPEAQPLEQMEVHTWGQFLQIPTHLQWMVDDAWVDQSVGFISGRSKSYKTWIALDLALSIVSGSMFLGRYPVRKPGPVLLIQEEDPKGVLQERLRLIGKAKGMLPTVEYSEATQTLHLEFPSYPLHIINLQGFNLGVEDKVAQVRDLIARINPRLVILDPLIVLLPQGVDENRGTEISQVLQTVKMWREEFGCSVAIVHHWNKTKQEAGERFAEHMYGSFAFHAWLESALHVMPVIEEEQSSINQVVVEREFKAAPSGKVLKLQFQIDSTREYTYNVEFLDETTVGGPEQQIIDLIAQGGPMTTPELVAATGRDRPKVSEICNRLVRAKLLNGRGGGGRGKSSVYWLPDQPEPPK